MPLAAQESADAPRYAGRPLVDVLQDLNRRGLRIVFSTSHVHQQCADERSDDRDAGRHEKCPEHRAGLAHDRPEVGAEQQQRYRDRHEVGGHRAVERRRMRHDAEVRERHRNGE